jgi:hypothetical protein
MLPFGAPASALDPERSGVSSFCPSDMLISCDLDNAVQPCSHSCRPRELPGVQVLRFLERNITPD